jgi:hypothetical protein
VKEVREVKEDSLLNEKVLNFIGELHGEIVKYSLSDKIEFEFKDMSDLK